VTVPAGPLLALRRSNRERDVPQPGADVNRCNGSPVSTTTCRGSAGGHRARAVMRRWGISPSNIQVSPAANSDPVGEDRADRGAVATGYFRQCRSSINPSGMHNRLELSQRLGCYLRRCSPRGCAAGRTVEMF